MSHCPGCLKPGHETFCPPCRRRMFDGKKVPHVLPFTRPAYDQVKLNSTAERLSISGIQTKIPLRLDGTRLEMTESGGQYILKPVPHGAFKNLDQAPINEHLTMQIARQVFKIPVAENALVRFADGEHAYLVRRFDVRPDGGRALQEDFAQVAQRSEETHGKNYKYDFSYEEAGGLIRRHTAAYRVELEKFVKLVAFNYLVHNGDAHLKNFSLIRDDQRGIYTLAPAYDLHNTRLHVPTETRTALSMFKGDFETPSMKANQFYALDDFTELARRLELDPKRFGRMIEKMRGSNEAVFELIERSGLSEECKAAYKTHVADSVRAFGDSFDAKS